MRTSSAEMLWPGIGMPLCQSTWMASMASRLTMHRAVDGRAGLGEDARDAERLVVVLDERDAADPVRDDDPVADLVAERGRDIGADHDVEQIRERLARTRRQATVRAGTCSA